MNMWYFALSVIWFIMFIISHILGILQFRPPFSYVNKYKKNKEKKIIESTEEAGSPSLQKVRVKFGRKAKLHSRWDEGNRVLD